MQDAEERYRSEWMDENRRSRRWVDTRTVLARSGDEEVLGKTRDLSVSGVSVEFRDLAPRIGSRLQMAVVLGDRVVDVGGMVLHRTRSGGGSAVGLEFDQPLDPDAAAVLSQRYPPAMAGTAPGG